MNYEIPEFVVEQAIVEFQWDEQFFEKLRTDETYKQHKLEFSIGKFHYRFFFNCDKEGKIKNTIFTRKPKIKYCLSYCDLKGGSRYHLLWVSNIHQKYQDFLNEFIEFEKKRHVNEHRKIINACSILNYNDSGKNNEVSDWAKEHNLEVAKLGSRKYYLLNEEQTALYMLTFMKEN